MLYEIQAAVAINQEDTLYGGWFSLEQHHKQRLCSLKDQCDFTESVANEFKVHKKGRFNSVSVVYLVVSYIQHVGSISLPTTP